MQAAVVTRAAPRFAPGELNPPPIAPARSPAEPRACPSASPTRHPEGLIEILLPGGVSVRVDADVDGGALRRVLAALESR
jgi:transposase